MATRCGSVQVNRFSAGCWRSGQESNIWAPLAFCQCGSWHALNEFSTEITTRSLTIHFTRTNPAAPAWPEPATDARLQPRAWQPWRVCRQCQSPIFPPRRPRKRTGHLGHLGRLARRPIYYILGEERRILSAARRGMNVVVSSCYHAPNLPRSWPALSLSSPSSHNETCRGASRRAPRRRARQNRAPLPEIQRSLTPYATCGCLDSAAPRARLSHRCLRRVGGSRTAR